jgi:para-nitrobenzyl esterase
MRLYFCVLSFFLSTISFSQSPVVQTASGKVAGYLENKVEVYKGIPFAAPPIGALRWKAPQPVTAWKDVKTCTAFSASPMQGDPKPFMVWSKEYLIPGTPISEDCLYLNVWTNNSKSKTKKAVFVYIYGGGFQSGGAACPIYDGLATAQKDIVFVSINYRVGVFAFLAHPELTKEAPYQSSGNYGLLDMIAALKWVKENIAAFGGDPEKVTIGGQSAGAFAVNFLCASPLAKDLFRGAIAESGGSILASALRPSMQLAEAEKIGLKFAKDLNCDDIAALRNKSSEEIFKAMGGLKSPIEDGYFLPASIMDIYQKGKQNDVPLLMGWNQEDIVSGPPVSAVNFVTQINKRYGSHMLPMLAAYPATDDKVAAQSQKALSRDETFALQEFVWINTQLKTGKSKVYLYNFNRQLPGYTAATEYGAFHTAEVAYAYDNLKFVERPFTDVDHQLAKRMSNYWANFIKTGNPNGNDLPKWNNYTSTENKVMILDENAGSKSLPNKQQLETLLKAAQQ